MNNFHIVLGSSIPASILDLYDDLVRVFNNNRYFVASGVIFIMSATHFKIISFFDFV